MMKSEKNVQEEMNLETVSFSQFTTKSEVLKIVEDEVAKKLKNG